MLRFALSVILMATFAATFTPTNAQSTLATLEPLQGTVQVLPADTDEWHTITAPIQVAAGDEIRTGENGWAVLNFFEGTFSEILANSHVILNDLVLPEAENDGFSINFTLAVGDTFNTVSRLVDDMSSYEIEMPGTTAAVRGTQFFTRVLPTGCSMVYTHEGSVATFSDLNADDPIMVLPGEYIVYAIDGTLDELMLPIFPTEPPQRPTTETAEPLASETCGDGVCHADEEGVCSLDCAPEINTCGDGICQVSNGEGLLTCEADCSSLLSMPPEDWEERMTYEGKTARDDVSYPDHE